MGIRFRKSMKVAPGVRMNVSKKSVGVSIGGKGARYSVSSSGRTTTSASIPGTGLSYVSTSGSKKKQRSTSTGPIRASSSRGARVGGIVMLVVAVLAILIGLLSISVGGVIFLVMGAVFLLLGVLILRKTKNRPEE